MAGSSSASPLPPALTWVCWFSAFESVSMSVVQGAPLQLFLLDHGAGPRALGVAAALVPLSMALQLPMALHLPRLGFARALAYGRGWRLGAFAVLALVAAGATWLGHDLTLGCAIVLAGCLHGLFALGMTARPPWWAALSPAALRGRFLARELLMANLALVAGGLAVTWLLSLEHPGKFPCIFLLAAATGALAWWCIPRIPPMPVAPAPSLRHGLQALRGTSIPRLLVFQLAFGLAQGGHAVCWIIVLRDQLHWGGHLINLMPLVAALVIIPLLPWLGRLLDRVGARRCLVVAVGLAVAHLVAWGMAAQEMLPAEHPVGIAACLLVLQGFATVSMNLLNLTVGRQVMADTPAELQAIASASMTLVGSLVGATFPILWGLIAAHLQTWQGSWAGWTCHGHGLVYSSMAVLTVATFPLALWASRPPRSL